MDDERSDPLAEVINLLAAPIASGLRSVEQMKRGVDEMWRAVENLNRTMETLNDTAERVNALLAEVEEPINASDRQCCWISAKTLCLRSSRSGTLS